MSFLLSLLHTFSLLRCHHCITEETIRHLPSCLLQIKSRALWIIWETLPHSTQPLQREILLGNQFMADFVLCQVNSIGIPVLLAQTGRNGICYSYIDKKHTLKIHTVIKCLFVTFMTWQIDLHIRHTFWWLILSPNAAVFYLAGVYPFQKAKECINYV